MNIIQPDRALQLIKTLREHEKAVATFDTDMNYITQDEYEDSLLVIVEIKTILGL